MASYHKTGGLAVTRSSAPHSLSPLRLCHHHRPRGVTTSCHAAASGADPKKKPPHSILFVAPVWPEVSSSAAGVRTSALVTHFLRGGNADSRHDSDNGDGASNGHTYGGGEQGSINGGTNGGISSDGGGPSWRVSFLSTADRNPHEAILAASGVFTYSIKGNRTQELAEVLGEVQPSVVVFDRFYAEEMFSFRVRELCPEALRVLDMQGRSP